MRKILCNLKLTLQGDSLKNLAWLKKAEKLSRDQIMTLQQEQLKKLLLHAHNHVPYYRDILNRAGVVRSDRSIDLANFDKIPFLTKDIMREKFRVLTSDDINKRKWYENTSGGSTGEPVRFIQDRYYDEWLWASAMLGDFWSGYSMGDRKIVLWGSERDLFLGREALKTRIRRWLKNERWLNAFRITSRQMGIYVKMINDFKPVQILAYADSIYEFSRFVEQNALIIYSPKAIMTSASTLYPHMRETIGKVFKAQIFNRYGSREVGTIACECECHLGLHIFPSTQYIEILKKDGDHANSGETGEIIITLLTNYAMPLIRYKIGDVGIWAKKECPCGRKWPLLKVVIGRLTDVFMIRDGSIVLPEYLIHLIGVSLNKDWIKKFQVIQEDYDQIRILIVPLNFMENMKEKYSLLLNNIIKKIQLVMGEDCKVEFEFVKDILPTSSGKYRYVISKVAR